MLAVTDPLSKCVLWRLSAFMRKNRGAKYKIEWGTAEPYSVNAETFHRAIASGWLTPTGERTATLATGVIARLRDGALWLLNEIKQAAIWIYTSWLAIDRISPIIQGDYFKRTLEREHCGARIVKREPKGTWWERCDWKASGLRKAN